MASRLEVINDGLVRLGVPPLASLSDQSAQALAADSIYTTISDAALSEHPWSFAYREKRLPKLSLDSEELRASDFEYVYQLPVDYLRVLGLRSYYFYQLAGDQMYSNDKEAQVVYVARVPESTWPAYFAKLISFQFAAAVAITLTEQTSRAELMFALADQQRRMARSIDSLQTPPHVFNLMRIYTQRTNNPLAQG